MQNNVNLLSGTYGNTANNAWRPVGLLVGERFEGIDLDACVMSPLPKNAHQPRSEAMVMGGVLSSFSV